MIPIFLQESVNDPIQFFRNSRIETRRRIDDFVEELIENDRRRVAGEGGPAGEHLVEDDTQRKQVGPCVELLAARLLGRHVGDGPHDRARRGDVHRRRGVRCRRLGPGQTEVQQLGRAAIGDEDVRRLDVPMEDACAVRGVQAVGQLHAQIQRFVDRQRAAFQPFPERLAAEQFHHDEELAVVFAQVMHHANIGMIQSGCRPGFTPEAGKVIRVPGEF